jgi:HNH endonuclease
VDGAVTVSMMVTEDNYPALLVNSCQAARDAASDGGFGISRTLWIPCHRYMCWLCNGPSRGDKLVVHHICEDKQCVNPAHLEWVTASENNALPNETVSRRRRDSAALQNRSPGTYRFKRRCLRTDCDCCTLSSKSLSSSELVVEGVSSASSEVGRNPLVAVAVCDPPAQQCNNVTSR